MVSPTVLKTTIPGNPPSVNTYLRRTKFTTYKTQKAKEYQVQVKESSAHIPEKLDGTLAMKIVFYFGDLRARDVDNYAKCPIDALQGIAFDDDKQIIKLTLIKRVDKDLPRTEVTIWEVPEDVE